MTPEQIYEFIVNCTPSRGIGAFQICTVRRDPNSPIEITIFCSVCRKRADDSPVLDNLR